MLLVEAVAGLDRGDELDGHEMSALVEELEDGVLGVGADPAPGDWRGRPAGGRAVELHRLAVRFHLQLLEIGRQQAQALVIGEDGAGPGAADVGVITVGEGGEDGRVFEQGREAEMAVHRRRALEQGLERVPAERQRGGKADRRPERVAAADALGEGQDPGLVDPELERPLGRRGQATIRP